MTIYFTASITGKKQYLSNYLKIIDYLKSKKFEVISDQIINTEESYIRLLDRKARLNYHEKLENWIKYADFVIAETSFPSVSVGYEISLALSFGKPILILQCEGDPPSLLLHHKEENIICEKYTDDTLYEIIDDFISFTEASNDTRFTFYMSHEQTKYLDKKSIDRKVPKSVYLRRLIDEDMKKI